MKFVFVLASLITAQAFANPFDSFVGHYVVNGSIQIENFHASECKRYGIPNLVALEVKRDSNGYNQTHVIYLRNPAGWSGIPVMQYEDKSDSGPTRIYFARISGDSNLASEFSGSNAKEDIENKISLRRSGDGVIFNLSEEYIEDSNLVAGCYYQATLK